MFEARVAVVFEGEVVRFAAGGGVEVLAVKVVVFEEAMVRFAGGGGGVVLVESESVAFAEAGVVVLAARVVLAGAWGGGAVRLAARGVLVFWLAVLSLRYLATMVGGAAFCQWARVGASGWRVGTRRNQELA